MTKTINFQLLLASLFFCATNFANAFITGPSCISRHRILTNDPFETRQLTRPSSVAVAKAAASRYENGGDELSSKSSSDDKNSISNTMLQSRRKFVNAGLLSTIASLTFTLEGANAQDEVTEVAVDEADPLINVYFGCGCFWHVQHEFVMAEKKILGRSDEQITARAGYAGGLAGAKDGKVCYHNAVNVADYGKLGHAEVVGLTIPKSKFYDFAVEYFKLFNANGDRPDQGGDRGSEYRSLVGIPGGARGEYAKILVDASIATGDKLDFGIGKGDDKDVRKTSFVMDNTGEKGFPFYVAEQYHQFHDGFNLNENYPNSYNKLAAAFAKGGEDFGSCPNGMVGLGIGGL
jgi:peptide methionine sulfoxide reductase MsrA